MLACARRADLKGIILTIAYSLKSVSIVTEYISSYNSVDTGRKLNVNKTFRRRPRRLLNVLCTFNLRPVSTGNDNNKCSNCLN